MACVFAFVTMEDEIDACVYVTCGGLGAVCYAQRPVSGAVCAPTRVLVCVELLRFLTQQALPVGVIYGGEAE